MARYHPLYEGFWDEPKLEGCSLEERGFAAYLFSNHRVRPSGIYRATPAQLAADVGIAPDRAIEFLSDLDLRRFLVVDNLMAFRGRLPQFAAQTGAFDARREVRPCGLLIAKSTSRFP